MTYGPFGGKPRCQIIREAGPRTCEPPPRPTGDLWQKMTLRINSEEGGWERRRK